MRVLRSLAVALVIAWVAFVGVIYWHMRQPPEHFAPVMAKMPMPFMLVLPFETLWNRARAGSLQPGDAAPDFELTTLDKTAKVRLSAYRGKQPVVLIFGSYT